MIQAKESEQRRIKERRHPQPKLPQTLPTILLCQAHPSNYLIRVLRMRKRGEEKRARRTSWRKRLLKQATPSPIPHLRLLSAEDRHACHEQLITETHLLRQQKNFVSYPLRQSMLTQRSRLDVIDDLLSWQNTIFLLASFHQITILVF